MTEHRIDTGSPEERVKALETLGQCPSTFSFLSVVAGHPNHNVECQLLVGHSGKHRAMYHGFPYYWEQEGTTK